MVGPDILNKVQYLYLSLKDTILGPLSYTANTLLNL